MTSRGLFPAALAALSLSLSACAMQALPPPQATLDNIQALRAAGAGAMAVGDFTPAPGRPVEMDRSIAVRAGVQAAPDGSFAKYLGETLAAQLKAAGKLDPGSSLSVSGVVTDTHVDSAVPNARAALAARFTLTRSGKVVFEKTLAVESRWDSELIGAVAIPDAFNHYVGLFPQLATKLFTDPEFIAAAR